LTKLSEPTKKAAKQPQCRQKQHAELGEAEVKHEAEDEVEDEEGELLQHLQ
jgi:hypothetical protein